ncbi:MAG TPA: hypothetical protein VFR29_01505 [Steroidobacteraceae bacterium]|nr:hypothetical protein [Steroidobacteraceae bacterium]
MRRLNTMVTSLTFLTIFGSDCPPARSEESESERYAEIKIAKPKQWFLPTASLLELNGSPPSFWKGSPRKIKVQPGTVRLLVGDKPRPGCWTCGEPRYTCMLNFEAGAGQVYSVELIEQSGAFRYSVAADAGGLVATCESTGPDKIDRLLERLAGSAEWPGGVPQYGQFPKLDLPATANAEELIAQMFKQETFPGGTSVVRYQILDSRVVDITFGPRRLGRSFLAVHVDTNLDERIVLFQYGDASTGWWRSRFYYAEPPAR